MVNKRTILLFSCEAEDDRYKFQWFYIWSVFKFFKGYAHTHSHTHTHTHSYTYTVSVTWFFFFFYFLFQLIAFLCIRMLSLYPEQYTPPPRRLRPSAMSLESKTWKIELDPCQVKPQCSHWPAEASISWTIDYKRVDLLLRMRTETKVEETGKIWTPLLDNGSGRVHERCDLLIFFVPFYPKQGNTATKM